MTARHRRRMRFLLLILTFFFAVSEALAQSAAVSPESEYQKRIKVSEDIQPLGENPFGESISLYNGALSFEQTDVSSAGIGPLLQLSRSFRPPDVSGNTVYHDFLNNVFVDWSLEIPRIETLSATSGTGNVPPSPTASWFFISDVNRCSWLSRAPDEYVSIPRNVITYTSDKWWHGYQLVVPGAGSQDILNRDASNTQSPQMTNTDGSALTFSLVTKQRWSIACLPQTSNGQPGEGFLAVSPDGTRYWMDALLYKTTDSMSLGTGAALNRRVATMAASKVMDRFGNSLSYSYDANGNLSGIVGSDGRQVTINYEAWQNPTKDTFGAYYNPVAYRIHSIVLQPSSGAPRTWTYSYSSDPIIPRLTRVQLPDGSAWSFALGGFAQLPGDGSLIANTGCTYTLRPGDGITSSGTITHPSGLAGTFVLKSIIRGRSNVPYVCLANGDGTDSTRFQAVYKQSSIQQKTFTGAGLPTQTWNYSYSAPNDSWDTGCTSGCASNATTDVIDPAGRDVHYTFSNRFDATESMLLQTDYLTQGIGSAAARSEINTYANPTGGPWPAMIGNSQVLAINSAQMGQLLPVSQKTLQQDGDTYIWLVEAFNAYAQPVTVKRYNSIAGQTPIEEQTTYLNDLPHWILGLPQEVDNLTTAEIESVNTYNLSNVTLQSRARFGQTLMSYTFDGQGQLASYTDGNNHTTHLSNYKRGMPQTIGFPDGTGESLVVDDFGQITGITDQAGNTTNYSYDATGRITSIVYPAGDTVAWAPKTFTYDYVGGAERGVAANHWRRTVARGDWRQVTFFDAMLHPLLSSTYRGSDGGLGVSVRTDFDWKGSKIFQSYPVAGFPDIGTIASGTSTVYDALERVIQVQQPSELGTLTSTTAYLSGARRQDADPKGNITITGYQVFDEPSYNSVIQVLAPESVSQTIGRDLYGNPLSITQGGAGLSITKTMVYDAFHRLCRTTEPESGSAVMSYDGANNVAWTASGLAISGGGCGQEQVAAAAMTQNSYDAMNRVTSTVYPSGTDSATFTYDPLGKPATATSGLTSWTYGRNKLGLLKTEVLSVDGFRWELDYGYDGNANPSSVLYPDGTSVGYAPDALGRPTQAGGFAAGAIYFPDGDLQSFTFGNGATYLGQENARNLLNNFSYGKGGVLAVSEDLTYDADANISQISDLISGQRNKSLSYDGLNRLTGATANGLWGAESYSYDTLNNIRSINNSSGVLTYNYSANNLLQTITNGAATAQSYQYDPRGNVVNKNNVPLNFDQANRLTSITGFDNYLYDAAGRRVKTQANGSATPIYYAYSQSGQLMLQYDPSITMATDYIYLGKKMVAKNVVDTSILIPSEVNVTLSMVGIPSLSADGQTISATVDIANHGTVTLTSSGTHPVHMSGHVVDASGTVIISELTHFNIPDIAPGSHAAVALTIPAASVLGTGNRISLLPVQEGVAWFDTWGTVPQIIGPYSACGTSGTGNLCNTSSPMNASQVNVGLTLLAGPTLSADGQTISATIDINNRGTVTLSDSGKYPVDLGDHLVDAAGHIVVEDITRAPIPDIAPGTHAAVSISLPSSIVLGTGRLIQFIPAQEGVAWFDNWGTTPVTAGPFVNISVPSASANGSYTVSWTGMAGAVSFNLREQLNGGAWTTVQSSAATSWNAAGRVDGTYGYQVQACANGGCGPWSSTQNISVLLPPPTPASISVPPTGNGAVPVSWAASPTATGYQLYQSFNGGAWVLMYSGAATSFVAPESTTGNYTFFVLATNSSGWNNLVASSATVVVTIPPASAPAMSVPATSNSGAFTVTWAGVAGATSYTLYESANGGAWTVVQVANVGSWSTSGRGNGTYTYSVYACNVGGCGPGSAGLTVTVALLPLTPTGLTLTQTGPFTKPVLHLSWNASAYSTSYQLEYTNPPTFPTIVYNATGTAYSSLILTNGTVEYRVKGCNAVGCSAFSSYVSTQLSSGSCTGAGCSQ